MAYLIHNQAKPCYMQDEHFINQKGASLSAFKKTLISIRKRFPCVRFYIKKIESEDSGANITSFLLLMYRYDFQREIFKYRFGFSQFNQTLFDWGVGGMLLGYSHEEIQRNFDEIKKMGKTPS